MSTAQFTVPLITVIPGQLITASLWNNEFSNLDTNLNPDGIGAYSDTDTQMQTSTDPYPSNTTSRPSALSGEIQRIRYILALITGNTYWYQHPAINLSTLNTSTPVIPSGTVMVFYQAAAPTGWTQVTTANDKALRVVSGTGGGSGGTHALSTTVTLAHTHTVASHTHDLANHTHTMGNHTHSTPNHSHELDYTTYQTVSVHSDSSNGIINNDSDGNDAFMHVDSPIPSTGASTTVRHYKTGTQSSGGSTSGTPSTNTSDAPSTNTSGTSSPATDSQLSDITLAYIDVIICSKN